jgi:hypothetical protein
VAQNTPVAAPLVEGDNDDDNLELLVCWSCGGTPCDWFKYSEDAMEKVNEIVSGW